MEEDKTLNKASNSTAASKLSGSVVRDCRTAALQF
jgi:hypothetical protein